jgi:hypothetical protein
MGRWAANGTYVDNTVDVADIQSSGLVPTEEQARYTPQTKEASAISVGAGAALPVATVNMDGFTTIGYNSFASASHAYATTLWASPDGTTRTGAIGTSTATNQGRGILADTTANFVIVEHVNNDAAAKTYDVWIRKTNR